MSEAPEKDQKTEAPTEKRRRDAAEKGDVLQSKELGTALVVLAGAAWLALAGPLFLGTLEVMLSDALTFGAADVRGFDPGSETLRLVGIIIVPLIGLFALTIAAAIGGPAMLGSLGFRSKALSFKGSKLNPLTGIKRIFGMQGLIELVKSLAKVILLGAVGIWLLIDQSRTLMGLTAQEIRPALASLGWTFILAVLVMSLALAAIALIDVPAQIMQRGTRLRMSKQEVKDEHKQTEGSPELKAAVRRRQHEVLRASARAAVAEATVVLTNPTHFAVALRYKPEMDGAPVVVARGRGATAEAIRELAKDHEVPILSYPQLARAVYFTTRTGQVIREDLYLAVATVLAFVFNLDSAVAAGAAQPSVTVPPGARFDEKGRPES
ncbi:flagellar type III secretion system protein FlhB [Sphingosinicella humi]|uniref:Flagellar biosynthesis protein FlhB n=1 Tax=Allosphingosinicella humi TaxID=2068657 RepID=A0A2U2J0Z2_9SPHN|nr:flagellar type III secretion system protein FlhB [Sphingosinicella humi]PWG02003.1 flagellar biosynthesis protein FlhB [Sphingosinicella humi]